MSAAPSMNLDPSALARLGVLQGTAALLPSRAVLRLGWPELERALPDRGLPRSVVEIAAFPRPSGRGTAQHCPESMRGGATSIAIAALSSVQAADAQAWCAWITPSAGPGGTDAPPVYAPALVQAGVDLDRLLVVRPPPQALARTVVKVAASGAFALVVIDLPHRHDLNGGKSARASKGTTLDASAIVVRKLALAAEERGTMSLLLTSALSPRSVPWPVAMRIEVERRPDALALRVTKDRRGPGASQHVVRLVDTSVASLTRSDESAAAPSLRAG